MCQPPDLLLVRKLCLQATSPDLLGVLTKKVLCVYTCMYTLQHSSPHVFWYQNPFSLGGIVQTPAEWGWLIYHATGVSVSQSKLINIVILLAVVVGSRMSAVSKSGQ